MRLLPILAVLCLVMIAPVAFAQVVQAGDFVAGPDTEGYSLNGGKGERTYVEPIAFDKPYTAPPKVIVALSGYDATSDPNDETLRVQISATKITKNGFTLRIKTWGNGRVGAVWGGWIAVGK